MSALGLVIVMIAIFFCGYKTGLAIANRKEALHRGKTNRIHNDRERGQLLH